MKKSLIAMAVAGVVAAPVTASAAEAYGRVNIGVQNVNDDASTAGTFANDSGLSMTSIASRFGFKGEEDLGNGMTAQYRYEFSTTPTTAALNTAGRLGWIGLAGDFGQVKLGQMWTAYYNHVTVMADPYWTGSARAYYGLPFGGLTSTRQPDTAQYNYSGGPISFSVEARMSDTNTGTNGEAFDTTAFAGSWSGGNLQVGAGFYSSTSPTGGAEPSLTGFSAKFNPGPWYAAAAYHMLDQDNAAGNEPTAMDIVGGMDFGGGLTADLTFGLLDADRAGGAGDTTTLSAQVQQALSSRTYVYGNFINEDVDGGGGADTTPQRLFVGAVHLF